MGRGGRYNAAFNNAAFCPMSRAWLLPEQIADVLPRQARRIEELRRTLIDGARSYGFELVMPPLLEHLGLAELEHNARNNRMRAI